MLTFSSFRAFLFRENKVLRPIRSTGSVRFFRRVGQVVGQANFKRQKTDEYLTAGIPGEAPAPVYK